MPLAKTRDRGNKLPPGWLRFISLPGELQRTDENGKVVATKKLDPEDHLKAKGWTEKEIEHGLGPKPQPETPKLRVRSR